MKMMLKKLPALLATVGMIGTVAGCGNDVVSTALSKAAVKVKVAKADLTLGGKLYDNWPAVLKVDDPKDPQPLYPAKGEEPGASWQCRQCHGYDYLGVDNIVGLFAAKEKDGQAIYDALTGKVNKEHDWSKLLSEDQLWDLVKYVQEGVIDTTKYISKDGVVIGDATKGAKLWGSFKTPGAASCPKCHGENSLTINFHADENGFEYPTVIATEDPWEIFHKIRFGQPEAPEMPAMEDKAALSNQDAANVIKFLADVVTMRIQKEGAQMYDKWWKISEKTNAAPAGINPGYPTTSIQTGSTTWRCKECHGWDYQGAAGAYGTGSAHYTGFAGVLSASTKSVNDLMAALSKADTKHDFGQYLAESELYELVTFIQKGTVDTSAFIAGGKSKGDVTAGKTVYGSEGADGNMCLECHTTTGQMADEITMLEPVGLVASSNPWEALHKIRWGNPGTAMPSGVVDSGWSNTQMTDVLAFAATLTTVPLPQP